MVLVFWLLCFLLLFVFMVVVVLFGRVFSVGLVFLVYFSSGLVFIVLVIFRLSLVLDICSSLMV